MVIYIKINSSLLSYNNNILFQCWYKHIYDMYA